MKKIYVYLTVLFTAFLLSSCATKMVFGLSQITPGADGVAKITTGKNGNYLLSVKVFNLTDPSRLTPPKKVYSVWTETYGGDAKNLGMIKVSSTIFSKTMKGSFETVSVTKPTKVFITAEENGEAQYPSDQVVLKTE